MGQLKIWRGNQASDSESDIQEVSEAEKLDVSDENPKSLYKFY